jgi:uncharacterized protein YoxC
MKKALIAATIGEALALVAVLAGYLVAIARTLRSIARTLGQVTMGVRAIEKQTEPIGPALAEVNAALERTAEALAEPASGGR